MPIVIASAWNNSNVSVCSNAVKTLLTEPENVFPPFFRPSIDSSVCFRIWKKQYINSFKYNASVQYDPFIRWLFAKLFAYEVKMIVIFIDLEMKPISNSLPELKKLYGMEAIEFGAVRLEGTMETDSFCRLVKPDYGPIPPRYEKLTGITNASVESADGFETVFNDFCEWCKDAERIYAWSGSDLEHLRKEHELKKVALPLDILESRWDDYQKIFTRKLGLHRELSLKQAVDIANLSFEGRMHDALWDARNTAELYRIAEDPDRWHEVTAPLKTVNCEEPVTYSLAGLFAGLKTDD